MDFHRKKNNSYEPSVFGNSSFKGLATERKKLKSTEKLVSVKTGIKSDGYIILICYTLMFFFIPSCGLVNSGSNSFLLDSQVGDPGDGKTPVLGPRLRESPDLADKECKDNDRCEEACRKIYEDTDSYKECYELTIGEVSKIEEVFHALVGSEEEDLEDIDEEDLERYIKVGLDGWRDKVIQKQKAEENRNDRFQNTFFWIVDQERDVIPVLETEDQDNEILEEIFLSYCNIRTGDMACGGNNNYPLGQNTDACASSTALSFDYSSGSICLPGNKKIAYIKEEKNRRLFLALVSGGRDFFIRAAENRRFTAFILGNKLVEKVCSNRDSTSFDQCVAAFYCHQRHSTHLNQDFLRHDDITEGIGREIDLKSCDANNYDDIDPI